jgi:hypothetical protein
VQRHLRRLADCTAEDEQHRDGEEAGLLVSGCTFAAISLKMTEPVALQIIKMPSMKPKSPMRLVRNALFAAAAAVSR